MFFFLQGFGITGVVYNVRCSSPGDTNFILRRAPRVFDFHRGLLQQLLNSTPVILHCTVEAVQLAADLVLPQGRRTLTSAAVIPHISWSSPVSRNVQTGKNKSANMCKQAREYHDLLFHLLNYHMMGAAECAVLRTWRPFRRFIKKYNVSCHTKHCTSIVLSAKLQRRPLAFHVQFTVFFHNSAVRDDEFERCDTSYDDSGWWDDVWSLQVGVTEMWHDESFHWHSRRKR